MELNTVERAIKTEIDHERNKKKGGDGLAKSVDLCQRHKPQHHHYAETVIEVAPTEEMK